MHHYRFLAQPGSIQLSQHYQFLTQAGSVLLYITASLWLKPIVLPNKTLPVSWLKPATFSCPSLAV
jgi:hypothetical protein